MNAREIMKILKAATADLQPSKLIGGLECFYIGPVTITTVARKWTVGSSHFSSSPRWTMLLLEPNQAYDADQPQGEPSILSQEGDGTDDLVWLKLKASYATV